MICYRCGNKLGSGHLCLRCGADVTAYRKIMGMSNSCYNVGLEKARARDLTGAVAALSKSVQLNKHNTDARNLLGLVYYEMGEVVEALCQWIVSKNLQPENNVADQYINALRKDRNTLEEMNQAIKKYNQALNQARNEGVDLAIITLKRVLKQHPKLIKAYQLLALCYIKNEEYAKANKILNKALEIDAGNTVCQHYSREIRDKVDGGRKKNPVVKAAEGRRASMKSVEDALMLDDDMVIPKHKERRSSNPIGVVLAFLAGMCVALCLYQFVVLPTVDMDANVAANQQIAFYDSQMADQTLELQTLRNDVQTLKEENERLNNSLSVYTGSTGVFTQYDTLMDIILQYMEGPDDDEAAALADRLVTIEKDAVDSDLYQSVYQSMYRKLVSERLEKLFNTGKNYFNDDYYTYAIDYFERCLKMDENYDQALYYLGLCYEHRHDNETANTYFTRIVQNCPNSDYREAAIDRVGEVPATPETSQATETNEDGDPIEMGEAGEAGEGEDLDLGEAVPDPNEGEEE